ncbi:SDR family NAD(P)-dependent oxidoreductase [Segnochrobactrum spirostomi]|uniref:SDR family oxidoreductase n=1 Tax=Segnochrobactrum spirostomi TaxID=2608987 RepID=A0A6A7Y7I3_9HYPH|nr:SDR family oxidoreductase [Segnochrobactrum spirostomi]MQT14287.1 SDR family oxidoreductase [Segnochrobactrum spirostomi]
MSGTERVVLVTGAAGGIGAATARRFAATGWRVVLTDRDAARLAEIAAALGDAPFRVADLADAEAARALPDWAAETAGRLDAVVNAAGIWVEGPAEAASAAEFDTVFAVNVRAVCLLSGAAIPHLKRTEGVIVNLSSDAGVQGNSGAALYCASKGAVSLYTKALALELAPFGVRVNAVCPGDVDTPMMAYQARRYGGGDEAGYIARVLAGYPQGPERARLIRAEEVAAFIRYLAEPDAAPITGALLSIDFGYSAGK